LLILSVSSTKLTAGQIDGRDEENRVQPRVGVDFPSLFLNLNDSADDNISNLADVFTLDGNHRNELVDLLYDSNYRRLDVAILNIRAVSSKKVKNPSLLPHVRMSESPPQPQTS
jgi:hypothetical protein